MPANSIMPLVHLFNPSLAEPGSPPSPFTFLRPLGDTEPWMEYEEVVARAAEAEDEARKREKAKERKRRERERLAAVAMSKKSRVKAKTSARGEESSESEDPLAFDEDDEEMQEESDGFELDETKTIVVPTAAEGILIPESPDLLLGTGATLVPPTRETWHRIGHVDRPSSESNPSNDDDPPLAKRARNPGRKTRPAVVKQLPPTKTEVRPLRKEGENPSLAPWALGVRDWKTHKKRSKLAMEILAQEMIVQAIAVQPRGAKFIVGVGDFRSIFVWKMK